MNKIIFAGKYESFKTSKNFEIIAPDGAEKITVVPPLAENVFSASGVRVTLDKALLPFKEVVEIPDDEWGGISHAAAQAAYYFNSDMPKRELILSALGELIVGYCAAFAESENFSPVVKTVRADIERGISDCTYSLEDSLKRLPLNYDYVRKLFKKETGATPHEYLLHERMKLAQGLILGGMSNRYSEYTVSQIAEACGYSDPLYFSRVFKKYFGVAPSEYK